MGKWFTLTIQYFSDGLVKNHQLYTPSFDFFSFPKYLNQKKFPQKILGDSTAGGGLGLHVSVALGHIGPSPQVDVALLALARALWRGRFPKIRGPGSAALEATRKTMRTTGFKQTMGGIHHGDGYICIYIYRFDAKNIYWYQWDYI